MLNQLSHPGAPQTCIRSGHSSAPNPPVTFHLTCIKASVLTVVDKALNGPSPSPTISPYPHPCPCSCCSSHPCLLAFPPLGVFLSQGFCTCFAFCQQCSSPRYAQSLLPSTFKCLLSCPFSVRSSPAMVFIKNILPSLFFP